MPPSRTHQLLDMMPQTLSRFLTSLSVTGVVVGMAFFCFSLTPSLLPRIPTIQGALSGVSFVCGYGLGFLIVSILTFLEIPLIKGAWKVRLGFAALSVASVMSILTLNRMSVWQNSIRTLMEMELVDSAYPFQVLGVAIVSATVLLLVVRGLRRLSLRVSGWVNKFLPQRLSLGMGALFVALVVGALVDGLVVRNILSAMDEAFAEMDMVFDDGVDVPAEFSDAAMLIDWDDIGRNGKRFLTNGPDREDIEQLTGRPAQQPVRVYAGFNTGADFEERAALAVSDLVRAGGFERSVLIIATPTGTGWLDPAAIQPVAYLHQGDLSIVSMQYSYLPSWLTLLIDPDRPKAAARALFLAVYNHWTTLPEDTRPQIYLFGLSLGALGSENSTDLIELISDPIDGAVWVGPPFASSTWASVTKNREAGSPQWRPRYRDGSVIRFMTQDGFDPGGFAEWERIRVTYLQHPSDPMTFFSTGMAFRKPAWLGKDRGRDISPHFRWVPIVSFLQVGFDIPMATTVSQGYGHNFVASEYIDAWISVTRPKGWSETDTENLKKAFENFTVSPL